MIWPFLFATLFVIFAWRSIYEFGSDFLDRCLSTLMLVVLTAIATGVGLGVASLISLTVPKQWTGPEVYNLVSLRNSSGVSGNFFLGTGSIGTSEYYFFYTKEGVGYRPGKVNAGGDVVVYEQKRADGELKVYSYQFADSAFKWIALEWSSYRYEFLIPEGSLKQNFVLQ